MKDLLFLVAFAVLVMIGAWVLIAFDLMAFKFFAPKYEGVRREVFEESKAYRQGVIQELRAIQFEYIKAEPGHKAALRSIILHRAADIDFLPEDLQKFVNELMEGEYEDYIEVP